MGSSEPRLRINSENVVHETIDGEVIIIDLSSGSYFSLSGSGPAIWEALGGGGATAAEVGESLGYRYEAPAEEIASAVSGLLDELGSNNLIASAETASKVGPGPAPGAGREPFVAPKFERYNDMRDYFLLDPIHEVGPEGWPKPAG
jgi:hypothetical protein